MSRSGPLVNEEAQRRMRERGKDSARRAAEDMGAVMSTPAGRRFVWRTLEEICGVHALSYTGPNAETYFREGRRDVGITLMREVQEHHPDLYVQALNEQLAAKREDRIHRAAAEAAKSENDNDD